MSKHSSLLVLFSIDKKGFIAFIVGNVIKLFLSSQVFSPASLSQLLLIIKSKAIAYHGGAPFRQAPDLIKAQNAPSYSLISPETNEKGLQQFHQDEDDDDGWKKLLDQLLDSADTSFENFVYP
jgi:hypothetical protein